jgi:hypothetical protein
MSLFVIMFPIVIVKDDSDAIHFLESGRFPLLAGTEWILEAIGKTLVVAIVKDLIAPAKLSSIFHELDIIDSNLITQLHLQVLDHFGSLTLGV